MPLTRPTTTPLPDEIYDEWAPMLGEAELKVLLYIVRRTLGFRKDADAISLAQFTSGVVTRDGRTLDRGCGVTSRRHIVRALAALEDKGLIRTSKGRTRTGGHAVTVYALRWEGHADATQKGGSSPKTPGGSPRTPGWCPSVTDVVAQGHQGSVSGTPTTNSMTTNNQQNSETTAHHEPDAQSVVVSPSPEMDAVTLWRAVLDDVRQVITPENYAAWFAHTAALAREGDLLRIAVPTSAHQYWLDVRLRKRVEETLRRLGYGGMRVDFVVAA